ncbi:S8 family serine peptidase, partial [bacterium]|nr:S8 family serine peptidase [bacterium]
INQIGYHRIKLPQGVSVSEAVQRFKNNPAVEYAGPNHVISICLEPNDEYFLDPYIGWYWQWGLYSDSYPDAGIDAPTAWDITTGNSNIVVAMVDTGLYTGHEDINGKQVPGINVIAGDNPSDISDGHGHGTFTSGIVAANTDNTVGIAGVSWGARIMPIKALDSTGYGLEDDAAAGIIWAADHGAKIINMSIGGYDNIPAEQAACTYAWNKGCVLVAASGNEGVTDLFYPACYDEVLSVGASNEYAERCTDADWTEGGSNYGSYLDVVAPGGSYSNGIMSTWNDGSYEMLFGTSAAAPFVSGIAALVWSKYPTWSNAQVVEQIKMSCRDINTVGWDQETGWGLVNAYRALVNTPLAGHRIGELNSTADGTTIKVDGAVITSGSTDFSDRLYVEQDDRACAIMLPYTSVPIGFAEGDVVEVTGTLSIQKGERAIKGATITKTSHQTPMKPLGVQTRYIGGGTLGFRPGATNGLGMNNVSLLVSVWGKVTAVGWTYFYIDDGCHLEDGSGMSGLRIATGSFNKPIKGSYVRVTGISSIEQPDGTTLSVPVVRVRRQGDIVAVN